MNSSRTLKMVLSTPSPPILLESVDEDAMDVEDAAKRERVDPVLDDDGYTLVSQKTMKR
jgi:hypothetical protein